MLRKFFTSQKKSLLQAFSNNDQPSVKRIFDTAREGLFEDIGCYEWWQLLKTASVPMLTHILDIIADHDRQGRKTLGRDIEWWNTYIASATLEANRLDLTAAFFAYPGDKKMNAEQMYNFFLRLASSDLPVDTKTDYLSKSLSCGFDRIPAYRLTWSIDYMMSYGMDRTLDIFINAGFDIHADQEGMLRYFARNGKLDACIRVVDDYGADLAAARAVENEDPASTLRVLKEVDIILKQRIHPSAETIRRQALEIDALRETVRELTAVVDGMTHKTIVLDKMAPPRN